MCRQVKAGSLRDSCCVSKNKQPPARLTHPPQHHLYMQRRVHVSLTAHQREVAVGTCYAAGSWHDTFISVTVRGNACQISRAVFDERRPISPSSPMRPKPAPRQPRPCSLRLVAPAILASAQSARPMVVPWPWPSGSARWQLSAPADEIREHPSAQWPWISLERPPPPLKHASTNRRRHYF